MTLFAADYQSWNNKFRIKQWRKEYSNPAGVYTYYIDKDKYLPLRLYFEQQLNGKVKIYGYTVGNDVSLAFFSVYVTFKNIEDQEYDKVYCR
jgi:hypothetical protein